MKVFIHAHAFGATMKGEAVVDVVPGADARFECAFKSTPGTGTDTDAGTGASTGAGAGEHSTSEHSTSEHSTSGVVRCRHAAAALFLSVPTSPPDMDA